MPAFRTLRHIRVKEFAHGHTPNERYSLNWNPCPEGSLREHGTSLDTDYIKWTTLHLE